MFREIDVFKELIAKKRMITINRTYDSLVKLRTVSEYIL